MSIKNYSGNIRELLITNYQSYPALEIQDVFKFLYQSAFGCEHAVSCPNKVTEYISQEYNSISQKTERDIEVLAGDYSRIPITYINRGLSAHTLGKLFSLSAKKEPEGMNRLLCGIEAARELMKKRRLPFELAEFESKLSKWQEEGYPSVHHSERYRSLYSPAYRVISNEYIPFLPLFCAIDQRLSAGRIALAVEGGSASGKTTLGAMLSSIYDCTVFHMDDFFLRPEQRTPERFAEVGGNIDRERFLNEVLEPCSKGMDVCYSRFDCSSMTITETQYITPKALTVIEGAYSMHPDLAGYYDLSVFLSISPECQKERILKRNTPDMSKRFFENWIPMERRYFNQTNAKQRCDMIIEI